MSEVTVEKLAKLVGTPVDKLLEQLKDAGVDLSGATDVVSEDQKQTLLAHLQKSHGESDGKASPRKITLNRSKKSSLKMSGKSGRTKSVSIEVRKKRTFVKVAPPVDDESAVEKPANADDVEDTNVATSVVENEYEAVEETKEKTEAELQVIAEEEAKLEEAKIRKEVEAQMRSEIESKAKDEAHRIVSSRVEADIQARMAVKRKEKEDAEKAQKEADKDSKDTRQKRYKTAVATPTSEAEGDKKRKKKKKKTRGDGPKTKMDMLSEFRRPTHRRNDDENPLSDGRRKIAAPKSMKHGFKIPTKEMEKSDLNIGEMISVADLAQQMSIKGVALIKKMMGMGIMATINQSIDQETAELVAEEMGYDVTLVADNALEIELLKKAMNNSEEKSRPPVVTIMGHVDHGKTSLLDYIRASKVADGEAGGITQHIGAYHVNTPKGVITFLDTPGHAAFTSMRARGANATDIVILVVAADDGVMPQTIEAIQHAKAAGVPLIVAVNKMDKEAADADRVKNELSQHEVISEEWGGDTVFAHVSAKTGDGIEALLESIADTAELLELKASDTGSASGVVIEARLDKGRGAVASVLVQSGDLKVGDIVLAGFHYGKVRALNDENGAKIKNAGPSIPVELIGLSGVPEAGDEVSVVANERKAREVAAYRYSKHREAIAVRQQKAKLENMFANVGEGEVMNVNVLVKADVQGSAEAISRSLTDLSTDEVVVNIISSGVGGIKESDVVLASAANAIVIGFNVRADATGRKAIEKEGVDLRYYKIIYEVIDDVKAAMSGLLSPELREEIVGLAEVRDVFTSPKFGAIAGCMVIDGFVKRNLPIRVLRDDIVIYEGELESLRRFKDEATEVRNGMECGIGVKNYNDVKPGDQIEVFEIKEIARTID
ncbi:MAG: translation initiation factor IF-2 [Kangiella sp.]|nr:MAG: translation initiation factor IF-2 [Kangiella sp.]